MSEPDIDSWRRPRHLLVGGGSDLPIAASTLWHELGRLLAAQSDIVVMTGGLESRTDKSGTPADRAVIDGMLAACPELQNDNGERIETYVVERDSHRFRYFALGKKYPSPDRTPQWRRFAMVRAADVVITIGGDTGTRSIIDAALALDRPVLTLPGAGGRSEKTWKRLGLEMQRRFAMTSEELAVVNEPLPSRLDAEGTARIQELAATLLRMLRRGFVRPCFVIMPFSKEYDELYASVIKPGVEAQGYASIRTDRNQRVGDVVDAIHAGIRQCQFAVVDLTDDRPNVFYELGLAHAYSKPTVLLRQNGTDGTLASVPFDLATRTVHRYDDTPAGHAALRASLEAAIVEIGGRDQPSSPPDDGARGRS